MPSQVTYTEIIALWRSSDYQDQVLFSVMYLIDQVILESPETVNHQKRLLWAKNAMANPSGVAHSMSIQAILDPKLQEPNVADEFVLASISNLINRYTE